MVDENTPGPGEFASYSQWHRALVTEFTKRVRKGIEFSAEDIRDVIGMPPESHPNQFGTAWRTLLTENEARLRVVGIRRSTVKSARGRLLPIYQAVAK